MDSAIITHKYNGAKKLSNLVSTTIANEDGSETTITYRKSVGGEYMDETLNPNNNNMNPEETPAVEPEVVVEPTAAELPTLEVADIKEEPTVTA